MAKTKTSKASKKSDSGLKRSEQRRLRKEQQREARLEAERAQALRTSRLKKIAIAISCVSVIASALCFFLLENSSLAALSFALGLVMLVPLLLGMTASAVPARSQRGAGAIDFGTSKR